MSSAVVDGLALSSQPILPRASVIVATRDRPVHLERALRSLLNLDYPAVQVVVVDQGDVGTTAEVIRRALGMPSSRWRLQAGPASGSAPGPLAAVYRQDATGFELLHVASRARGLSHARNLGADYATGEILAFTDDDCTVPSDWLERIGREFQGDPLLDVLCGALDAAPHDSAHWHVPVFRPPYSYAIGRSSLFSVWPWRLCVGANLTIRRAAFLSLRGFDTRLGAGTAQASSEDSNFVYRAVRRGAHVRVDAANVITHWGARRIGDGEAGRLLHGSWRGLGASCGVLVKSGDGLGLVLLARPLMSLAVRLMTDGTPGQRSEHLRFARSLLRGFLHGLAVEAIGPGTRRPMVPPHLRLRARTYWRWLTRERPGRQRRWGHVSEFDEAWKVRIERMARFIDRPGGVADIGCGPMWLEAYLPAQNTYVPVDYLPRDSRTIVVDLNRDRLPALPASVAVLSGVLEYVRDVPGLVSQLAQQDFTRLIVSYNAVDRLPSKLEREAAHWVNHLHLDELLRLLCRDFALVDVDSVTTNTILVFDRKRP